jgi:hypothetical protein
MRPSRVVCWINGFEHASFRYCVPVFYIHYLLTSSIAHFERYEKHQGDYEEYYLLGCKLHGVTFQAIVLFIVTAVITSDPAPQQNGPSYICETPG